MPTTVEFHTGVGDDLGFACRLLRKAYHKGARVLVRAPSARLAALDRALWTFAEREFIPHLRISAAGAATPQAARTPIWLTDGEVPPGAPPVLVNLGADVPTAVQAFDRVIEIVGTDADEAQRGRARWRAYQVAGLAITHHPAAGAARG